MAVQTEKVTDIEGMNQSTTDAKEMNSEVRTGSVTDTETQSEMATDAKIGGTEVKENVVSGCPTAAEAEPGFGSACQNCPGSYIHNRSVS